MSDLAPVSPFSGAAPGPYYMLGMRIDTLDPIAAIDHLVGRARLGASGYCCVGNVHQCMLVHDNPGFAQVVNGADLVVTDSRVLHHFIARKYCLPSTPTMFGATLMLALCAQAAEAGIPIGLVGGRDDDALDRLITRLTFDYPALRVAYRYAPPFRVPSAEEERVMIEGLRASGARLVFVGLGCPKQERWMATHSRSVDAMLIGVGAAFDFNGGEVRRSPPWVHAAGLEWAYRLASEPRRLWRRYLIESPRFLVARWREERGRRPVR